MKTKLYLTALALPVLFAACNNEEDLVSDSGQGRQTLTVTVDRGQFGADTRAAWSVDTSGAKFEWTGVGTDKIGLALLNPADASKVVTNYEMTLVGWYNANGEGIPGSYNQPAQDGVTQYTTTKPTDGNAGAGVFEATGLTVMDGDYIVYHPYDGNFAKAGYMAVDFKTDQEAEADAFKTSVKDAENKMLEAAGNNSFSYSQPTTIEKGGKVASGFATTNLSSLLQLQLKNFNTAETLKKVILLEDAANYDAASKGFLKSGHLNAEKIKTQRGVSVLEGPVYTSMVKMTLQQAGGSAHHLNLSADANVYMVAGPRASKEKFTILLINKDNKASVWRYGDSWEAGQGKQVVMDNTGDKHPFDTYIVTDGADLKTILETGTTYDDQTINVLGDIVVEDLGTVQAKNITVQAYGENPETNVKFVAKSSNFTLSSAGGDDKGLKFNTCVTMEAEGSYNVGLSGKVEIRELVNKTILVKKTANGSVGKLTNEGKLTVQPEAVLKTTGDVVNNGEITIAAATTSPDKDGGTWNIGRDTKLTNNGEINNYFTVNNFGEIDNTNGVYVQKLAGKFIGQNEIAEAKAGNYVIEVGSDEQFKYANEKTKCTTVRVVNAEIQATDRNIGDILKGKTITRRIELTGNTTGPKLNLEKTKLNGGLYIIDDGTTATIAGDAMIEELVINAAKTGAAPKLTIEAGAEIKAKRIVNDGQGSIKEGAGGIPADVRTNSSTGDGTWDNWPQVVSEAITW